MSLAALHGCRAAKHRFKDRQHGKKIYNSITLESEICGAAEQALTIFHIIFHIIFDSLLFVSLPNTRLLEAALSA